MSLHLAQVNIARAKAPLDSPLMADFVAALDQVNALADASPGFIWRLQTSGGNATAVRAYDDPQMIFNMSIWESVAALKNYVYRSMHGEFFARRQTWFEKMETPHMAMWWIPIGCIPEFAEGKRRLEFLSRNGESSYAFTFLRVSEPELNGISGVWRSSSPGIQIRTDNLRGPEIAELLTEHLRCLAEVSPPESRHALNLDELRKPEITFWSAWQGHEIAGCGALKELEPKHGEIKSMRTAGKYLRKGVASLILHRLISEAKRRGYRRLSLETGSMDYFEPARHLYQKFGFTPCPPFIGYVEDPNSVFMTKEL